jgi:hypothetical protein
LANRGGFLFQEIFEHNCDLNPQNDLQSSTCIQILAATAK